MKKAISLYWCVMVAHFLNWITITVTFSHTVIKNITALHRSILIHAVCIDRIAFQYMVD